MISNKGFGRWHGASSPGDAIVYIRRVGEESKPIAEWSRGVSSIETAAAEMTAIWRCSQAKEAVDHRIISWAEGERPSIEEAQETARIFMRSIGYGPTTQYVAALHDDGQSGMVHLHMIVNRLEPVRVRVADLYDDYAKGRASMRELEREQGWRELPDEALERTSVQHALQPKGMTSSAGVDRYNARQVWRRYVRNEAAPVFAEAWERNASFDQVAAALGTLDVPARIDAVFDAREEAVVGARVTAVATGTTASVADLGVSAREVVERYRDDLAAQRATQRANRTSVRERAVRVADVVQGFPKSASWAQLHDAAAAEGLVYEPWLKRAARIADAASAAFVKATEVDGLARAALEKKFGPFVGTADGAVREAERLLLAATHEQEVARNVARDPSPLIASLFDKDAMIGVGAIEMDLQRRFVSDSARDLVREAVLDRMTAVEVKREGWSELRFTTEAFIEEGRRVRAAANTLLDRSLPLPVTRGYVGPEVVVTGDAARDRVFAELREQSGGAYREVTQPGPCLRVVTGVPGAGKTTLIQEVADAYRAAGYDVRALSVVTQAVGILRAETDLPARSFAKEFTLWGYGKSLLTPRSLVIVDEFSTLGSEQGAKLLEEAARVGAVVIAFGDDKQCPSVARGSALGLVQQVFAERGGAFYDLEKTARQRIEWMREATHDVRAGRVGSALAAYREHGAVHEYEARDDARAALVQRWREYAQDGHDLGIAVLTNADRRAVNMMVRDEHRALGRLTGDDHLLNALDGRVPVAVGERVRARTSLPNPGGGERLLGNGVEATVTGIDGSVLYLRWKNVRGEDREDAWDTVQHPEIEHAYATTTQREQGRTGWGELLLLNGSVKNQTLTVGMTRHQYAFEAFYATDDFRDGFSEVVRRAERFDAKENASDARVIGSARDGLALAREARERREGVKEQERADAIERMRNYDDALSLAG